MTIIGIMCGLTAAFFMSLAFVFSSRAMRLCPALGSLGLLARAHILMGLLSVVGLCFFWVPGVLSKFYYWFPITWYGVMFYLLGQGCLFMAQRTVDPSRLVPLLGLKLIALALFNALLLRLEAYAWTQLLAIACTILSAFMLNNAGRKIPFASLLWVLLACCGYSLSDICIKLQVERVGELGTGSLVEQSLLSACLSYTICGIIGTLILPWLARQPAKAWRLATPFALTWMVGIVFLFACFEQIGTVNGNIVQSTRSIWAVLIGVVLARTGQTYLEEKTSWDVFFRRLFAALLLMLAIFLYNL
jgi:drug/metabolite transporter (DMT)-like permease